MTGAHALLLLLALWGGAARAEAPDEALRPEARPAASAEPRPALAFAESPAAGPAPARPRARVLSTLGPEPVVPPGPSASAVAFAPMPPKRPGQLGAEPVVRVSTEAARGGVCNNPLIQGEAVASVRARGGCGISDAVRVRSVDGVRLSEGALMDCATASSLLDWVLDGARPAIGARGGGLAAIDVMGHYACRPRNNQRGARLSEHGRGRAIDVGALVLRDGTRLNVLRDWPDPALRAMHEAACGPFSTVLGPEANALHRDHFHFDTARGRGPYCR